MIRRIEVRVGLLSLKGVVLDLSLAGARVHLVTPSDVTAAAILMAMLQCPDGITRPARRCWQRGDQIGFEFLPFVTERILPIPADLIRQPNPRF